MLERLVLAAVLLVAGFAAYQGFTRHHLRRIAERAPYDPVLQGLTPGVPTVVYFTTPTCIPCRTQQQPALALLQDELGSGVQIVKIDATQDPDAAGRWGVFSAPTTFVLDRNWNPREINHGVADADKLKRQILKAVAV